MFNFKEKSKAKTLQDVTDIVSELKSVQFDIKEMDAFVKAVVKGEIKTIINLKGEKLTKEYNPNEGYEEEPPRSIIAALDRITFTTMKERAANQVFHITENLDEKLLLEVMAVLLRAKEKYRDYLIARLEKHGLKL